MFATRANHYDPLPNDSHDGCESAPALKQRRTNTTQVSWTLVVVLACTLVNVLLAVLPALSSSPPTRPDTLLTRQNIHRLRRPNQYIGFDAIPRPSPPVPRTLSTYPILLSLVDAASPETVFEDAFATQMVHSGTITPDDRRVRVTPTISTIVQFRAIDWGMETCELHIDLPESYGQEGHSGALGVYRVNATVPLDSASLSYATRPPRVAKLGQIPLGRGDVTWHRKYHCVTDEVLSFELGCLAEDESGGDPGCFVEWVQVKDAVPAIHMIQYSTV